MTQIIYESENYQKKMTINSLFQKTFNPKGTQRLQRITKKIG